MAAYRYDRVASSPGQGDELAPFVVTSVQGLEEAISKESNEGHGAYGAVYKVTVNCLPCIAKRLHKALVEQEDPAIRDERAIRDKRAIQENFRRECITLSRLTHPNVVHFVGVHYGRDRYDLTLLMECLDRDLDDFLNKQPNIPLSIKLSILLDVSYGLLYLHSQNPPIVHRDLTARNVLLTADCLTAKIADVGVAKMLDAQTIAANARHTQAPGQMFYMPPEALHERPDCSPKLDIFSFGHLTLYTVNQKFPDVFTAMFTPEAYQQGTVQLLQRRKALDLVSKDHCLLPIITQCLHDSKDRRPSIEHIHKWIKDLSTENPKKLSEVAAVCKVQLDPAFAQAQRELGVLREENAKIQREKEELLDVNDRWADDYHKQEALQEKRLAEMTTSCENATRKKQQTEKELVELNDRNTALEQQMIEYVDTIKDQSKSHDLELASMKEKCDAWQEEVERLAPFRDEVEQLQEEIASLRNDNAELSRGMQSVVDESEKRQSEMTHKIADYDRLMSRFVELQQTRVTLEKELQPLREERGAILIENATLREGSQLQSYTKLKKEYEDLSKFCEHLESKLEEQSALINAHQDTNVEMQQKLDKATDPERLQSIRERMERYKQERDASRKQIDELKAELVDEQHKATEVTEQLSEVAGKTEEHIQTANQQMQQLERDLAHLSAKATDYEGRMRCYREERNKLTASNKQLREQLATLQATVNTLLAQSSASSTEDPSYLESLTSMTTNYSPELEASYSPTRERQPSSPLAEYQPQQHTTDEDQYTEYSGHIESPVDKVERSLSGLTVEGKPLRSKRSSESSSSSKKDKQQHYFDIANVKTKEGIVSMYIQKPQTVLNAKYKPRVVVKRGEELFEAGTLMFVGNVGGKDLAGIQLDLRQPKPTASPGGATSLTTYSNGTYRDGKRYFTCPVGYGLYVTLSRIYIEMETSAV